MVNKTRLKINWNHQNVKEWWITVSGFESGTVVGSQTRGGRGELLSILVPICWDFPTQSFLEFTKERSGKEKISTREAALGVKMACWGQKLKRRQVWNELCLSRYPAAEATVNAATNCFRKLGMGKQVLNSTATFGWNKCTHPWHSPMWSKHIKKSLNFKIYKPYLPYSPSFGSATALFRPLPAVEQDKWDQHSWRKVWCNSCKGKSQAREAGKTYLSPEIGHSYLRSGTISHLISFPKCMVMTAPLWTSSSIRPRENKTADFISKSFSYI